MHGHPKGLHDASKHKAETITIINSTRRSRNSERKVQGEKDDEEEGPEDSEEWMMTRMLEP